MVIIMAAESDNEDLIIEQVKKDNLHFKALLNLIPPQYYFNQEQKQDILGIDADEENDAKHKQEPKKKKFKVNPFTTFSVTDILEMKHQGHKPGDARKKSSQNIDNRNEKIQMIEEKHKNKKLSRNAKGHKNKGKEKERRVTRTEELKEKLRKTLEEIKAKRTSGSTISSQELKKLRRKEKKVNAKLKNTNKTNKEQKIVPEDKTLKPTPQKAASQQNGADTKLKFEYSISLAGHDKFSRSSEFRGRDYKRLLEKVEKRKERVDKLKEKDKEAGNKLEEKFQWQAVLSKAKGEKVKDDPNLLKKAAKRKDKIKEKRVRKWGDRVKNVDELKQKRQQKRQVNIEKRKGDNKEKKRKKMIKKGRIIPGF